MKTARRKKTWQAQADKIVADLKLGSVKAGFGQGNHRAHRVSATARHGHQSRAGHGGGEIKRRKYDLQHHSFNSAGR
jgi:hypothetical protein